MPHALIPDFSFPLLGRPERVPFHADPILAAIERHEEAWAVFQVAPDGEASLRADEENERCADRSARHALRYAVRRLRPVPASALVPRRGG